MDEMPPRINHFNPPATIAVQIDVDTVVIACQADPDIKHYLALNEPLSILGNWFDKLTNLKLTNNHDFYIIEGPHSEVFRCLEWVYRFRTKISVKCNAKPWNRKNHHVIHTYHQRSQPETYRKLTDKLKSIIYTLRWPHHTYSPIIMQLIPELQHVNRPTQTHKKATDAKHTNRTPPLQETKQTRWQNSRAKKTELTNEPYSSRHLRQ
jgi:hypothetical protein